MDWMVWLRQVERLWCPGEEGTDVNRFLVGCIVGEESPSKGSRTGQSGGNSGMGVGVLFEEKEPA